MEASMVRKLHCRKPLRVVAAISLTWCTNTNSEHLRTEWIKPTLRGPYLKLLVLQQSDDQGSYVLDGMLSVQYGEQIIEHHYL